MKPTSNAPAAERRNYRLSTISVWLSTGTAVCALLLTGYTIWSAQQDALQEGRAACSSAMLDSIEATRDLEVAAYDDVLNDELVDTMGFAVLRALDTCLIQDVIPREGPTSSAMVTAKDDLTYVHGGSTVGQVRELTTPWIDVATDVVESFWEN